MEDDQIISKFESMELRIQRLEEKENSNFDENSVIAVFLDIFRFKRFLEIVLNLQKNIKFTQNFINLVLLFLFLFLIFWQDGILKFGISSGTLTLFLIIVAGIFELLGANTSIFKRFFFGRDYNTKLFIDRLPSMTEFEIERSIKNKTFSPMCMSYFIKILKEKEKYSPHTIYVIIDSQALTTENLDLLFSKEIIPNLNADVIVRVLYKCENFLKATHLDNIYDNFKFNETVLKVLFATQKYSDSLLNTHPENKVLNEYHKKFQLDKIHLNWKLKLCPISYLPFYAPLTFVVILFFVIFLLLILINLYQLNADLRNTIISIPVYLAIVSFMPYFKYFLKSYRKYYINQIIKS